jgi:hypothetical protein
MTPSLLDSQRRLLARITRPCAPDQQPAGSRRRPEDDDDLISIPINCSTAGDNIIVAPPGPAILIRAIQLWNVTAQTLGLYNGPSAETGSLLTRFTNFPGLSGYLLSIEQLRWWRIPAGNALILNLENSTQVDGFVSYSLRP